MGPGLPAGVFAAPAPHLPTGTARHLFVDGVRARRTRMNSTMAVPGLHLESRSDCPACFYASSTTLNWSNAVDVEFVYSGVGSSWSCTRAWGNVVSFQNGEQQYMYCQHSIVRSGRTLCLASPRRPTPNHGLGHCCVVGEIVTEDACYTLFATSQRSRNVNTARCLSICESDGSPTSYRKEIAQ